MTEKGLKSRSEADEDNSFIHKAKEFFTSLLSGYAQIFFSLNPWVGAIFLAATFIAPQHGATGLLGLLLANGFAVLLGMPSLHIKSGYFAYNGLLQGLALGMLYRPNLAFFIMLIVASLLGVLIAAAIRAAFDRYLGIPPLSFPFVLTTWIMAAAAQRFHGLIYTLKPFEVSFLEGALPEGADYIFKSLGAAFFQVNIPAGILIALGIFIFSRHAFILALIGLISGAVFHLALGGALVDLAYGGVGFNFALTAIAVGGVWVIPGLDALFLAALASAASALIASGSAYLLAPFGLPPLAFPFVAATSLILYALKNRAEARFFSPVWSPAETPELNLKSRRNANARALSGEIPSFYLPVSGAWKVTQSFDGEQTHKGIWAHALDFEIFDEEGKPYRGQGETPQDFYAYNKPVLAPAEGKVVKVVNHIEDNAIGQVNKAENWGNIVILWHYGSVYTVLCHLAKGSVVVNEGDFVRRGQKLAKVGNSGRSPTPHLHFQAQYSHEIGAPTAPSKIANYIALTDEGQEYITVGVPKKGEVISALDTDPSRFDALSFALGGVWLFETTQKDKISRETWKTDIDFAGNRYLTCEETGASLKIFVNNSVMMPIEYRGKPETGLSWLFLAAPRVPLTKTEVFWRDEPPVELLLTPFTRFIFDFFEPFFPLGGVEARSRFGAGENGAFAVETSLKIKGPFVRNKTEGLKTMAKFSRERGLIELSAEAKGEKLFYMKQINENESV